MSRYTMPDVRITEEIINQVQNNCSSRTFEEFPKKEGVYEIAYGLDHACGWFLSLVPVMGNGDVDYEEACEMDGVFTRFTGADLGFILRLFDGNVHHINKAFLDLEF